MQSRDSVPHFEVRTLQGEVVAYRRLWQRNILVLVTLPAADTASSREYADGLAARLPEFTAMEAACVVTRDTIAGLPAPGAAVADRWGEIVYVATVPDVAGLPAADDLLEWVQYVQSRCPECEGEAR